MPSNAIEKRRHILINAAYFALILGLFYLFMKYAFWLLFPFLLAFLIASLIQRPTNFIVRKTPLKKGLVSAVFVILIVIVAGFIISLIGIKLVSELKGFLAFLGEKLKSIPNIMELIEEKLISFVAFLPDSLEKTVVNSITEFMDSITHSATGGGAEAALGSAAIMEGGADLVQNGAAGAAREDATLSLGGLLSKFNFSMLSTPFSGVWSTAKQIPSILIAIVVGIVACFFMSADYDRISNFVKRQISPEKRLALSTAKGLFYSSMGKLIRSYMTILAITAIEMIIGLNVLRLVGVYQSEYIFSIAITVALVDIIPILGTGTILVPWALYCFLAGNIGQGIGLAVMYAVITVVRQILEPKLLAANLGLPPIVTIFGMFIGLQLFGFIGLFIVPIVIIMVKLMNDQGILHIWKTGGGSEIIEQDETGIRDQGSETDTEI
ncbi:MAG: AI-2E family transporter [Oscillospiraceae bacterium]|nr:AI-2E family transporter [Oscillospiraceae bacterium]